MISTLRTCAIVLLSLSFAACGDSPAPSSDEAVILATKARPLSKGAVAKRWAQRHRKLRRALETAEPDLLFIGDSLMQSWQRDGADHWERFYGDRNALNLGIDADRTETLLWRLQQYPLEEISPKLAIVLIGTNNTGHRMDPAEETVMGIRAVTSELEARLPNTQILLLAIFPREDDPSGAARARNEEINALLAEAHFSDRVHFRNINHVFVQRVDGRLSAGLTRDGLHLSDRGYLVWASAMKTEIARLLAEEN